MVNFCPHRIALVVLLAGATAASAQETENPQVVVRGEAEELPSAYGAPPDLSHGRISTLTKSYVLSPFSFELESGYEGDIFRHGLPAHLFRQEIEMGLPARFTVGVQNQVEHFAGDTSERSFTLEARYALADWNKLSLNPTISVEYRFGLDNAVQDSGEFALLISHDFPHLVEWAMNIFVDGEFGDRESTSAGFAQSVEVPVLLPEKKLEVGLEMQYRSGGETSVRTRRELRSMCTPSLSRARSSAAGTTGRASISVISNLLPLNHRSSAGVPPTTRPAARRAMIRLGFGNQNQMRES